MVNNASGEAAQLAAGILAEATGADAAASGIDKPPAEIGESFTKQVLLSSNEIRAFAVSVDDRNPLHHELEVAYAAGYPGLIASGTQISSLMMAMTATHFSRNANDGYTRLAVGMRFDIRFKAVVLADEDIDMEWRVTAVTRKDRLAGWVAELEGTAKSVRGFLLTATGILLLRITPTT